MPRTALSADLEKLLHTRPQDDAAVVSLYLSVPKDPEGLRGLPARAGELLALAAQARPDDRSTGWVPAAAHAAAPQQANGTGNRQVASTATRDEDGQVVRHLLEQHGRDWLGHTVAIFVSSALKLSRAFPLPCSLPDRAVLAPRPHVRPLLVAGQRCPAALIVIIDRQHARLFRVNGEEIETVAESSAQGVRSPGFGGWYGLDSHRIHERINQLARHHFRETAGLLAKEMRRPGPELAVIGGHEQTIPQFTAMLTADVRARVGGTFIADPHTLTPARARELARPVIGNWVAARERRLISEFRERPPGRPQACGLAACLSAVNQRAVAHLLIPVGGMIPGFACSHCGALSSDGDGCPHGPAAARPVPDLIEEMATSTLDDGGEVGAVREPPDEVAALLRFPVNPAST